MPRGGTLYLAHGYAASIRRTQCLSSRLIPLANADAFTALVLDFDEGGVPRWAVEYDVNGQGCEPSSKEHLSLLFLERAI